MRDAETIDFAKINRTELARDLGISLSMASRMCSTSPNPQKRRRPNPDIIRAFAEWLGCDPGELAKVRGWV
jgi:hypothetical protein